MYKKSILKNGATLVTYPMKQAFSVSIGVWLKVGSRYEDVKISGISHFLEHVVFKGSKKYDNETIKREIEGRGGSLNGFTSEELTCYLAKVPNKITQPVFKILLDMALNPLLKQEDIQKEKTVIIEEIKMYKDLPQHMVLELLEKTMWPDHSLGRNIAGTENSVSSISKDDLTNFKDKYYRPENMVIVFAGNVSHNDCLDFVHPVRGRTPKVSDGCLWQPVSNGVNKELRAHKAEKEKYVFEKFSSTQKEARIEAQAKEIEQTKLAIGFHAYNRSHPKRFPVALLSIILGGNMSSRLFNEIREKRGLVYEIASQYKLYIDSGAFFIHAGLDNKKMDLALELILKELAKLKKEAAPEAELNRAKEFCLCQLAMSLEDTMDRMVFVGDTVSTTGEILEYDYIKKQIQKVKPSQIKETANEIFSKGKINISLVGPVKDFSKDKGLDLVNKNLG